MADSVLVHDWQPFFMTLGGASAALAGLVFVAMSLHAEAILSHQLTRARAFAGAVGFLIVVVVALIMLMPAGAAPLGSLSMMAIGSGGTVFVVYQQFLIRRTGANVVRVVLGDLLVSAPVVAGFVGLVRPDSQFPFVLAAIAGCVALLLLFSQSWALVLHHEGTAEEPRRQGTGAQGSPQVRRSDD